MLNLGEWGLAQESVVKVKYMPFSSALLDARIYCCTNFVVTAFDKKFVRHVTLDHCILSELFSGLADG